MTNTTQINSLSGTGISSTSSAPFVDVFMARDPTENDINYPIQKKWLNTDTTAYWMLEGFTTSQGVVFANWVQLNSVVENTFKIGVDASTPPGTNPVLSTSGGQINVTGGQVAAGTTVDVIQTDSLAENEFTIQIQRSQAVASSTVGDNGVCHFSSSDFSVDGNGFVTISGSGVGTTITGDTGGPLSPTAGNWNIVTNPPSAGGTVAFNGSGSTLELNLTDSGFNTALGNAAGAVLNVANNVQNTAVGDLALSSLNGTFSGLNVAVGYRAMASAISGSSHVAIGNTALAGFTGGANSNVSIGTASSGGLKTGGANICIGHLSANNWTGSESSNIIIGNQAVTGESNAIRIGVQGSGFQEQNSCYIAGINGNTVSNQSFVTINTVTGQLGTTSTDSTFSVNLQTFSTTGTYTPTTGMQYCTVRCIGGGGAGGGTTNATGAGGGGGAGEYSEGVFSSSTIGVSQTVTIGAGGVGVVNGNGGSGGTTSLGALLTSIGGSGGANYLLPSGGIGGTGGTGGNFRSQGQHGSSGSGLGGNGASSQYGAGGVMITIGGSNPGVNATPYGSGGSGSNNVSGPGGAAQAGGNGSAGVIIITEYIST